MTAATFTRQAQERLKWYLGRPGYIIPVGLGDQYAACSIAAINIAISGQLTSRIPDCMSMVIGKWIITTQDAMPEELRNSERWKAALVRAAGTGRALERERSDIVVDWMWEIVLPAGQAIADNYGFGEKWRHMCAERSAKASHAAAGAGYVVANAARYHVDEKCFAANIAAYAAYAADSAKYPVDAADYAASAMKFAASSNVVGAKVSQSVTWEQLDPIGLLERLNDLSASVH